MNCDWSVNILLICDWSVTWNKLTVVRSTSFKWKSLTLSIWQLLVDSLGHSPALLHRLVAAHSPGLGSVLLVQNILAHLLVHLVTLLNILHHWSVFVSCHTGGLVLRLTNLVRNLREKIITFSGFVRNIILYQHLSVLWWSTESLHRNDALLHGLGDGSLGVVDVALLPVVVAAEVLGGWRVLSHV